MHARGTLRTLLLFTTALAASGVRAQHDHAAHAPAAAPAHSSGFYLPEPMPLQDFALVDHGTRPFTRTDLEGHWTLVVFGYTHCPDVCPTTLAQVRDTLELLRQKDAGFAMRSVLVSIDPERDTPEQLAGYVGAFGAGIVGLTGSPGAVAAFAKQFKVMYAVTERLPDGYFMDHSSAVALLTPDAELRALFGVPLRPATLADDLYALAADPTRGDN
jgi:protein SCO1/2